ncbi:hypothetical protein niasHT_025900 [Heterodera trifolii]|uniref:Uncharacterized protein n=1 Tax=Heterodera trifolii TaxID=157864 RepID=A0ABD2JV11_9BILA
MPITQTSKAAAADAFPLRLIIGCQHVKKYLKSSHLSSLRTRTVKWGEGAAPAPLFSLASTVEGSKTKSAEEGAEAEESIDGATDCCALCCGDVEAAAWQKIREKRADGQTEGHHKAFLSRTTNS